MMFGPNGRALWKPWPGGGAASPTTPDRFHHREPAYRQLLQNLTDTFHHVFSLRRDHYQLLFITGSGTLANEMFFRSLANPRVHIHGTGHFAQRLRKLALSAQCALYTNPFNPEAHHRAYVQYDTFRSEHNLGEYSPWWHTTPHLRFVDCVSAFPYYWLPAGADVWTTVSSKIIGALPIIGIVGVKHTAWDHLREEYSYSNLAHWAARVGESPHTPAIPLLYDLLHTLHTTDYEAVREKITTRRREILAWLSLANNDEKVYGVGPVLTLRRDVIPDTIADRFGLYAADGTWQLYLYAGSDAEYETLLRAITDHHASEKTPHG